jgi:hypothetical protein
MPHVHKMSKHPKDKKKKKEKKRLKSEMHIKCFKKV